MNAPMTAATPLSAEQTRERLGAITRQLHEAIAQLGLQGPLKAVVAQIPDARERLDYVGQMTDRAAHKVLGLVEEAQPRCRATESQCLAMAAELRTLQADPCTPAQNLLQGLSRSVDTLSCAAAAASQQHATLSEIMVTQDFQDLSGQVIKKVIQIISDTETNLLSLLIDSHPTGCTMPAALADESQMLQGPQTPDKAMAQGDVDDLLASMGF